MWMINKFSSTLYIFYSNQMSSSLDFNYTDFQYIYNCRENLNRLKRGPKRRGPTIQSPCLVNTCVLCYVCVSDAIGLSLFISLSSTTHVCILCLSPDKNSLTLDLQNSVKNFLVGNEFSTHFKGEIENVQKKVWFQMKKKL